MAASGSVVLVSTTHWCAVNSRCFEQKLLLHLHTMVCSTKLNFFLQWAHLGFFGMSVLYLILSREKKTPTSNLAIFFLWSIIKHVQNHQNNSCTSGIGCALCVIVPHRFMAGSVLINYQSFDSF